MSGVGNIANIRRRDGFQRLVDRMQALEKKVVGNTTANTLNYAQIGSGGSFGVEGELTVTDPASGAIIGTLGTDTNGSGQRIFRPGGAAQFESMGVGAAGASYTLIRDVNGYPVVKDDPAGGLAAPFVSMGTPVDYTPPTATTTSTSWTTLQVCFVSRWWSKVMWAAIASSSAAGCTGQARVLDAAGNQIGPSLLILANSVSNVQFSSPVAWPAGTWAPGDAQIMQFQAKVTAGTGTVGLRSTGFVGWASS